MVSPLDRRFFRGGIRGLVAGPTLLKVSWPRVSVQMGLTDV